MVRSLKRLFDFREKHSQSPGSSRVLIACIFENLAKGVEMKQTPINNYENVLSILHREAEFTREKSYLQALKADVEQYVYSPSNNLTFLHRYSNGMCGHDGASSGMSGHHYERVTIRSDRAPGVGFEPTRPKAGDLESPAVPGSATPALARIKL